MPGSETIFQESLKNKVVLVTGASSGIGQGIAILFGKAGMKVLVNYHSDEDGARETQRQIRQAGSEAEIFQADVSSEEEVKSLFEKCRDTFGVPDVLIGNAGIQKDKALVDMSLDEWNTVIGTNLTGQFLCAREAARMFLSEKENRSSQPSIGNIIFISSVHDKIPWAKRTNYTASKGGLMLFMKSVAQELAPERIRVNSISPGAIKTDINKESWEKEEGRQKMMDQIPYKRIGVPDDIAKAALWLASDAADYVTGTTLYVDGGMTLYPSFSE